ncbi:mannose-6-phosphate isomerase, class I [uncultured Gulosibacter sp.]|uniref:mannose-6-phosphate isomerase, class I n=1 Tax=uncultured Gulosibacter sp. TaxID=1339167 RepID=UPI0028894726|nr:mannose-6-phosphate isomerase, class I [uncultured Gulosibacter sp.]
MFVPLENTPMRYAWGARGAISDYLGTTGAVREPETGGAQAPVQAELWLGAHHGSPALITNPELVGGYTDLRQWIEAEPERALGQFAKGLRHGEPVRLPFLLKVLAASEPLSLQVHPDLAGARQGYAAENEAGIAVDDPARNYRDPFHKPELLIALSETMSALAGFRSFAEVRELVADIAALADETGTASQFAPFAGRVTHLNSAAALRELVAFNLSRCAEAAAALPTLYRWAEGGGKWQRERATVRAIRRAHPDDASVLTTLLMNHVTLHRGEGVYIRAGVLHAYVEGVGIEVMAASDNVLRGGLTAKHMDVAELMSALSFAPTPPPYLSAEPLSECVTTFDPDEPDFRLQRVQGGRVDVEIAVVGPSVLLNLGQAVEITDATGETIKLAPGKAVFTTPDAPPMRVVGGDVDLVVASTGVDAGDTLPLD